MKTFRTKDGIGLPIVNSNGTPKDDLMDRYLKAIDALDKAIVSLRMTAPHRRDYGDPGAALTATNRHHLRIAQLTAVRQELIEIAEAVCDQPNNRTT